MMLVLGMGFYCSVLFYLIIYVYFKVLLFLGLGFVIYLMEIFVGYCLKKS